MYTLKIESAFDSAHFLSGYEGKCGNIHGHRWRVEARVSAEELVSEGQQRGMLLDFKDLKKILRKETEYLDHAFIIEKGSLPEKLYEMLTESFRIISVDFRPTAENFSKYFFDRLKEHGLSVYDVTVYETPNNCATYSEQAVR